VQEATKVAWSRQTSIYCINVRQFTPEGTFAGAAKHLDRIKALGVGIIWLLPIHPIGAVERKGSLGSYYAVKDYKGVNSEFGTLAELKQFVTQCHQRGLKIILDWVANHTAWDHIWTQQHHDWYKHNEQGQIFPVTFKHGDQVEYWTDVVALDFTKPALWDAMIDAMGYWVRETDIDGFRCDVAGMVPMPFWQRARRELDSIKPMFMLAEWFTPQMHDQAFDMTYDTQLFDVLKAIAKGAAGAADLKTWWHKNKTDFAPDAYRMIYTANHDTNSWQGCDRELFGPAWQAMAVLAATLPGMPLIYGGQESGFTKRLAFFEKDPIEWGDYTNTVFYKELMHLKARHPALANGAQGGALEFEASGNEQVLQFSRTKKPGQSNSVDQVRVTVNLSDKPQSVPGRAAMAGWSWQIIA
jgi:glycosidase